MTAKLEPNVMTKVSSWLNGDYDIDTKQSIQQLIDEGNDTELTDAFYKDLEFGTGGLRGLDRDWIQPNEPLHSGYCDSGTC
jgi:phosphoglucomutase